MAGVGPGTSESLSHGGLSFNWGHARPSHRHSWLVGIVRSAVWMILDIVETLLLYGMASRLTAAFLRNLGTRQHEKHSESHVRAFANQLRHYGMVVI